ncbi:MAG: hypothetical protein FJ387_01545 [Verrucomicrobia bacterium]|nr:hypothetical protein [Verrucomicrobiota bacterium]
MRITVSFGPLAAALCTATVAAPPQPRVNPPPQPPIVTTATPPTPSAVRESIVYNQQAMATRPVLVSPEQARSVIDRFKAALPKLGNPRILLYINRELVDERSGYKLASQTEKTVATKTEVKTETQADPNAPKPAADNPNAASISAGGNVTIVGGVHAGAGLASPGKSQMAVDSTHTKRDNTWRYQERPAATLADQQTVRDLERLFGRPLRMAGARLADQRVATQLIGDDPLRVFGRDQAAKDREVLARVADVVLEILISSRNLTVPAVSGDQTYAVPDIQATAIRMQDAQIIGQATAADVIGIDRYAARLARNFGVREIAEATALALMEDMLIGLE